MSERMRADSPHLKKLLDSTVPPCRQQAPPRAASHASYQTDSITRRKVQIDISFLPCVLACIAG